LLHTKKDISELNGFEIKYGCGGFEIRNNFFIFEMYFE
jgi:hypothetical protein